MKPPSHLSMVIAKGNASDMHLSTCQHCRGTTSSVVFVFTPLTVRILHCRLQATTKLIELNLRSEGWGEHLSPGCIHILFSAASCKAEWTHCRKLLDKLQKLQ